MNEAASLHSKSGYGQHNIWISSFDGTGMRCLGGLPNPELPGNAFPNWAQALAWTPDNKRLSFVYKDALWTIPAR